MYRILTGQKPFERGDFPLSNGFCRVKIRYIWRKLWSILGDIQRKHQRIPQNLLEFPPLGGKIGRGRPRRHVFFLGNCICFCFGFVCAYKSQPK